MISKLRNMPRRRQKIYLKRRFSTMLHKKFYGQPISVTTAEMIREALLAEAQQIDSGRFNPLDLRNYKLNLHVVQHADQNLLVFECKQTFTQDGPDLVDNFRKANSDAG